MPDGWGRETQTRNEVKSFFFGIFDVLGPLEGSVSEMGPKVGISKLDLGIDPFEADTGCLPMVKTLRIAPPQTPPIVFNTHAAHLIGAMRHIQEDILGFYFVFF